MQYMEQKRKIDERGFSTHESPAFHKPNPAPGACIIGTGWWVNARYESASSLHSLKLVFYCCFRALDIPSSGDTPTSIVSPRAL